MLENNSSTIRKREPTQQRGIRSKEKLASAARTLINLDGFDQITAYKISVAAGTSVGTFYAYFTDKQDVFRSIVEDYAEQQYRRFCSNARDVLESKPDFETAINDLLKRFYEMHKSEPRLHEEIVIQSLKDPAVLEILGKNDQRIVAELLVFLTHFVPSAIWNPADIYLIQTTLKSNVHEFIFSPTNIPVENLLSKLSRMIFLYIENLTANK